MKRALKRSGLTALLLAVCICVTGFDIFRGRRDTMYNAALRSDGNALTLPSGVFVSTSGSDNVVGTDPLHPMRSIPSGIARAMSLRLTNVYIARGIYTRGGGISLADHGIVLSAHSMRILGGFSPAWTRRAGDRSILDGGLLDGARVLMVDNARDLYVDGFRITGGTNVHGAAIYVKDSAAVVITNCEVTGCSQGGGSIVFIDGGTRTSVFSVCIFGMTGTSANTFMHMNGVSNTFCGSFLSNNNASASLLSVQGYCPVVSGFFSVNHCFSILLADNTTNFRLSRAVIASNFSASVLLNLKQLQSDAPYGIFDSFITNNGSGSGTTVLFDNLPVSQPDLFIKGNRFGDPVLMTWTVREFTSDIAGHSVISNIFITNSITSPQLYTDPSGPAVTEADISPLNGASVSHDAASAFGNIMTNRQ